MERFRSKVDTWLLVILLVSMVATVGAAITVIAVEQNTALITLPILLLGVGLPAWLLMQTHYTIGDGQLAIRSGPFSWRIEIADIRSVSATRNPLSSPALSLDRLQIVYGSGRSLMISPADKNGLIQALRKVNAGIRFDG